MTKILGSISILAVLLVFFSCQKEETAVDILQGTINTIDTIESIYYKQDMSRSDPRNPDETIERYREMYFKRLVTDSIVGVKGHWYMYVDDKEHVIYEDIYDGEKLIRKNHRDSLARVYDLIEYPDFKKQNFWGHNTLYGMQYEFKYMLDNMDTYAIERLNDTLVDGRECFQILVTLEDKMTMPGFAIELHEDKGSVSKTSYFIDRETLYPIRMESVSYSHENPAQKMFLHQRYFDIKFNLKIDEDLQFNTSTQSLRGLEITEMTPE